MFVVVQNNDGFVPFSRRLCDTESDTKTLKLKQLNGIRSSVHLWSPVKMSSRHRCTELCRRSERGRTSWSPVSSMFGLHQFLTKSSTSHFSHQTVDDFAPTLTQKPVLQSVSEVQRPGSDEQVLPSVLQVRVVGPDTLSGVAFCEHLQARVPSLQRRTWKID